MSANLNHQLASAELERDSFKAQIERAKPNDSLRITGPGILKQLDNKVRDLELEMRRVENQGR